jgi:hypothetical protein
MRLSAEKLRARRRRVDDAPAGEHAERARDAHLARVHVHPHFDELRAESMPRDRLALVTLQLGRRVDANLALA